jgi:KDO2-lipid IV(A) lauroyltransferase
VTDAAIGEAPLPERRADRPVTALHVFEYALVRALFVFFRVVGVDAASAIAGGFMRAVGPLLRPISRRAEENLKAAFPDWDAARQRATIAGVWENLGRVAGEFAHLDKFRAFDEGGRIELVGAEHIRRAAKEGGAAIFVSGHFANWELMAIAMHQAGVPTGVVYRAANNPLVDEFIIRTRARVMGRRQIPKGQRGVRAMVDAVRSGASLAMLVDQKLNDGIAAPLFGRPAMTTPAPARLALKFGLALHTASIERVRGAHFRIFVREAIAFTPTGDDAENVRRLTAMINAAIEEAARRRPEQWLWLHRRWPKDAPKTQT